MKKIIIAALMLVASVSAFSQPKPAMKDTVKKVEADTMLMFKPVQAGALFQILNISREGIAHTSSSNITVEQANQALQAINAYQKFIKDWADKVTASAKHSNKPTLKK